MQPSSIKILDVGCGPGIYVQALRAAGFHADGVDPDPRNPYDKISVFADDFPERYKNYDLCLCLEVGEHLPEKMADLFVSRLVGVAPTIFFSAALPEQGGHGHINCQPKAYWANKFAEHNYVLDANAIETFREFLLSGYHMGWLANNVQIFREYGAVCFEQIIAEETPQAARLAEYFAMTPNFFTVARPHD
jgi:SAM-dependent methyltransferase